MQRGCGFYPCGVRGVLRDSHGGAYLVFERVLPVLARGDRRPPTRRGSPPLDGAMLLLCIAVGWIAASALLIAELLAAGIR